MTTWTSDELTRISTAEELQIASLRRDGTQHNPVEIQHLEEAYQPHPILGYS